MFKTNLTFKRVVSALAAGEAVHTTHAERYLSLTFNRLYFAARDDCALVKTAPFWAFIDRYCPVALAEATCRRCLSYSASNCIADQNACYAVAETSSACPYIACRAGVLDYFITQADVVVSVAIAFIVFQFALAAAVVFLLLHNTYKMHRDPTTRRLSMVRRKEALSLVPNRRMSYNPPPAHMLHLHTRMESRVAAMQLLV